MRLPRQQEGRRGGGGAAAAAARGLLRLLWRRLRVRVLLLLHLLVRGELAGPPRERRRPAREGPGRAAGRRARGGWLDAAGVLVGAEERLLLLLVVAGLRAGVGLWHGRQGGGGGGGCAGGGRGGHVAPFVVGGGASGHGRVELDHLSTGAGHSDETRAD